MFKNILYIYGLGSDSSSSTAKKMQEMFPEGYKIHTFDYTQENCEIARKEIYKYIKDHNIDLVIGSSLGGFITLTLNGINRFVINPCYYPTVELPKLGCDQEIISTYTQFESMFKNTDIEEKMLVVGFFGDNDELFGTKYESLFKHDFKNIVKVHSGHKASDDCIQKIIDYLPTYEKLMIRLENYVSNSPILDYY